jgi:ELWxxDGT repeat protein
VRRTGAAALLVGSALLLVPAVARAHSAGTPGLVRADTVRPQGSNPSGLTAVDGTLFFSAFDDSRGEELWKSDGTEAGTVLVKDIEPGPGDSSPVHLTNVNGILFFSAFDDAHGFELWKSDGTKAGTVLVKDIEPGPGARSRTH